IWLLLFNRRIKVSRLNKYLMEINQGRTKLDLTLFTDSELGILRSELFRLSETLHRQNEQLIQDKKFILDSLNDIAHQLKTPLTSIVMMVDLIQDGNLPPEKQEQFILNIESQLDRLKGLIANLLTLSKLEANVINYQPESIMDTQLINQLVSGFEVELKVKDLHLEIESDNQLVSTDVDWTIEALSNIIKNGIEHTAEGGTIRILSTVNLMYWQIIIEDNGSGIKEEDIDHVFDRFYRGKTSRKDSVGIGLSLTKRIINQQKGLIKVESQEGQFTRFIIRFLK
ncbi:MAG: HAMP domain-containing histidine kinase, partial [Erysipelothrix sp.]|nr:HAMP domain-containing histidine kinase [Erysipelothrix sp.]